MLPVIFQVIEYLMLAIVSVFMLMLIYTSLLEKEMSTLYIVRGLPGSGKTTLAKKIAPYTNYCADDYFHNENGDYIYDSDKAGLAHAECRSKVELAMQNGEHTIVVHNTFAQPWEAQLYYELCEKYRYTPFIIECQNKFGNVHGVSQRQVDNMRARWLPLN